MNGCVCVTYLVVVVVLLTENMVIEFVQQILSPYRDSPISF